MVKVSPPNISQTWVDKNGRLTKSAHAFLESLFRRTGGFVDAVDLNSLITLAGDAQLSDLASNVADLTRALDAFRALSEGSRASELEEELRSLRRDMDTLRGQLDATVGGSITATDLSSYQPLDSDLTAIAVITPSDDDLIQRKAGAWINRTPAQLKTDLALVKGDVGLGNVDNTSDANKPVSTAQQTALNLKAPLANPNLTGTVTLGDATFYLALNAGNPNLAFDTNDYIAYDRAGNSFALIIGGGLAITVTAVAAKVKSLIVDSAVMLATTTNFTNGAAAAAGTLANAPTAGDPTKWIPVDDNGTTRYIPAW